MNVTAAASLLLLGPTFGLYPDVEKSASPVQARCISASDEAQKLRDGAKLVEARAQLLACAQPSCPRVIRNDCADWLQQVEARLPTVVVKAVESDGQDVSAQELTVDGKAIAGGVDGKELPIDPGPHVFRAQPDGREAVEQRVVVAEREKGRIITLVFPAPAGALEKKDGLSVEAAPLERKTRPAVWIFGGVALIASGVSTFFAISGIDAANKYRGSSCAPGCPESDKNDVLTKYHVADAAAGVAVVGFGMATYFLLKGPTAPQSHAPAVDVGFRDGGGIVRMTGSF